MFLSLLSAAAPVAAQGSTCAGRQATAGTTITYDAAANVTRIVGSDQADVIVGTSGRDIITGLGGNDIICGVGGNDSILGGAGNDVIIGGDGNDQLRGGNGHDIIRGNKGNDEITGGRGDDNIDGGQLNDSIAAGPGIDTVTGNVGADTCRNRQTIDTTRACESAGGTAILAHATRVPSGVQCTQASLLRHYTSEIGTEANTLGNVELRLRDLINETRAICGLDPVAFDQLIDAHAQIHSVEMLAAKNSGQSLSSWFGHSTRWAAVQGHGGREFTGENVSFIYPALDPVLVHRNLISSGSHLCNLLSPKYDWVGLGLANFNSNPANGVIVTQIFAGDSAVERTSGTLTVLDNTENPRSGSRNCWS